jgi:hypothetical protein
MSSITRRQAKRMVGPGWGKIIDTLYDHKPRRVVVLQVKEKFGSLRFYTGASPREFDDLIDGAEWESAVTCEVCGEQGTINDDGAWMSCRCPKCREEEKERIREKWSQSNTNTPVAKTGVA